MFTDYLQNITEKEYRESPRLSYSLLKDINDVGPLALCSREPKTSDGLTLGSIVDKMIQPEGYNPLDDYILTDIKIDLNGTTHINKLLRYISDTGIDVNEDYDFTEIFNTLDFKKPPKLDEDFWLKVDMIKNGDKYLLQSEYELAIQMYETLITHDYTKNIFNNDLENIYQAKIFFNVNGEECKSMPDLISIDHENKIIYPIDIKTGTFFNFMKNFYEYKYYIQGGLYTASIQSIVQTNDEFKGYTVAPFQFVSISRQRPDLPLVYEMSDMFVELSFKGWTNYSGKEYKGIFELINEYKWYKNNECTSSKEIVENDGKIFIQDPVRIF